MFDDKFIAELAARIAARLVPAIQSGRVVKVGGGRLPPTGASSGNGGNGAAPVKVYPRLLTVSQAAVFVGRSKSAVEHLIHRREIPVVRHGRSVRLDVTDLQKWLEKDKV
jgi:excisionase family DNA binding protein